MKKKWRFEYFWIWKSWYTFTLLAIYFSTKWIWRWGLFHWKVDFKGFSLSTNLTYFGVRTASIKHFEVGTKSCQRSNRTTAGSSGSPVRWQKMKNFTGVWRVVRWNRPDYRWVSEMCYFFALLAHFLPLDHFLWSIKRWETFRNPHLLLSPSLSSIISLFSPSSLLIYFSPSPHLLSSITPSPLLSPPSPFSMLLSITQGT